MDLAEKKGPGLAVVMPVEEPPPVAPPVALDDKCDMTLGDGQVSSQTHQGTLNPELSDSIRRLVKQGTVKQGTRDGKAGR